MNVDCSLLSDEASGEEIKNDAFSGNYESHYIVDSTVPVDNKKSSSPSKSLKFRMPKTTSYGTSPEEDLADNILCVTGRSGRNLISQSPAVGYADISSIGNSIRRNGGVDIMHAEETRSQRESPIEGSLAVPIRELTDVNKEDTNLRVRYDHEPSAPPPSPATKESSMPITRKSDQSGQSVYRNHKSGDISTGSDNSSTSKVLRPSAMPAATTTPKRDSVETAYARALAPARRTPKTLSSSMSSMALVPTGISPAKSNESIATHSSSSPFSSGTIC